MRTARLQRRAMLRTAVLLAMLMAGWLAAPPAAPPTATAQELHLGETDPYAVAGSRVSGAAGVDARTALIHFTEARFERRLDAAQEWLAPEARRTVTAPGGGAFELVPASNPCWYRYAVEAFAQPTPATATARVRVYEHQWPGDVAGTLPQSWAQEIDLVQTHDGWRVSRLRRPGPRRAEAGEPHGPTTSACNVGRRPPVWLPTSRPTSLPATGGPPAAALPVLWTLGLALIATGVVVRLGEVAVHPAAAARRARHSSRARTSSSCHSAR